MTQQSSKADVGVVVQQALDDHSQRAGPLLPILRQVQEQLRHIPSDAVGIIAKALNLSRAEVHGVVTFYHTFTSEPQGKHVIEVCRAESCQAMGGRAIESQFKKALGIDYGQTTQDGLITLEPVYCLGNCGCSPAVRVGDNIYGRVNTDKVDRLVAELLTASTEGA
jgi:formate dehydrogenase subunit gamma